MGGDGHGNAHIIQSKQDWEAKFAEAKASGKKIVVDFWAEWCGPCRMIAPHFARLSEEMTNWIFLKVDVDSQDTLSAECGIRAMPTFQFYDSDGKKIDELVGASIDALTTKLKTL